jgi:hypothetical protein
VPVMILEVDTQRKRIRLSAKKAVEKQARREVDAFLKDQEDLRNKLRIPTDALEAAMAEAEQVKEEQPPTPQPVVEATPHVPPIMQAPEVKEPEPEKPAVEEVVAATGLDEAPPESATPSPEGVYAMPDDPGLIETPVEAPASGTSPVSPDEASSELKEESDDDRELISGEEFDDTGKPDLGPSVNHRGEGEEIDLIEGHELDDK